MNAPQFRTWQSVQEEVLRRIHSREWKPGDFIPNEADLSVEFGCARATVNRALRALAETGLIERKRKAGTQVAMMPVRKATLDIPVIRHEIEGKGQVYRHILLSSRRVEPPAEIRARMHSAPDAKLLHLVTLHTADGRPYVIEDRWISPEAVPQAEDADFTRQSPNEWLVANIPFEGGDIAFSARMAGKRETEMLDCRPGDALFVMERSTWNARGVITNVRMIFAPGYRMQTQM